MRILSPTLALLCWAAASLAASPAAMPSGAAFDDDGRRLLLLEAVEFVGIDEVAPEEARRELDLRVDEAVDQDGILAAVERLEASRLFASVDFYTRPGSERGRIVLVLEVEEHPPRSATTAVSVGTGVGDLDGWYLIPLALEMNHLLERDDALFLRMVIGYRLGGLEALYRNQGVFGGPEWWGVRLRAATTTRIYFHDDVEVGHVVDRDLATLMFGRPFGDRWSLALELGRESIDPEDEAAVNWADDPTGRVETGDDIAYEDLPAAVRSAVGSVERTIASASFTYDGRSSERLAATPRGGVWSRLRMQAYGDGDGDVAYARAGLDLRSYATVGGNALALRAKGLVVGKNAPFYDRLYLGGLYTVRGFPSQSLTPAAGSTWLWSASLELRRPLSGSPERPRLAGSLFLDVGDAEHRTTGDEDVAAGVGCGLRWRVIGLLLGADFGVPLTDTPVDEAFHANVSLGWSF